MQRILPILALFAFTLANAQFKNDNVKYITVYPEDLCKTLQANPGYVILDVRSQGEYDDTLSSNESLNIGHIKNAQHISIQELPMRWKELLAYKDKPLFIYCSHSQRSRRASRLLSDSGFTKIFNINGGLTNFYDDASHISTCTEYLIAKNLPYTILPAVTVAGNIKKGISYTFVDLRDDSVFLSGAPESKKVQGRFEDAIRIPYSTFNENFSKIPNNKPLILVDEFGNESPQAARLLTQKGYKNVNILFNGMDAWSDFVNDDPKVLGSIKWKSDISYKFINADDFYKLANSKTNFVLLDVRPADEFNNTSKNYWQNIGHIKDAINIPSAEIKMKLKENKKDAPIIVYGFNSQDDIYQAAKKLKDAGYTNVQVLLNGIWYLRWASHNLKGKTQLNDLVIDVPADNL